MDALEKLEDTLISRTSEIAISQGLYSSSKVQPVLIEQMSELRIFGEKEFIVRCCAKVLQMAVIAKAESLGIEEDFQDDFYAGWVGFDTAGDSTREWALSISSDENKTANAFDAGREFATQTEST